MGERVLKMDIKNNKKFKILVEMAQEAKFSNYLTNWHLNDYFIDFTAKYYPDTKKINQVKRAFNRYANMLVKIGILKKAQKIGAGWGSYSEFGSRTQTIWEYNFEIEEDSVIPKIKKNIEAKII